MKPNESIHYCANYFSIIIIITTTFAFYSPTHIQLPLSIALYCLLSCVCVSLYFLLLIGKFRFALTFAITPLLSYIVFVFAIWPIRKKLLLAFSIIYHYCSLLFVLCLLLNFIAKNLFQNHF